MIQGRIQGTETISYVEQKDFYKEHQLNVEVLFMYPKSEKDKSVS